jgi:DNA-binding phage protein
MHALRAISDARGGIAKFATTTGLSRATLYRTLSRSGNSRLSTLLALVRATGDRRLPVRRNRYLSGTPALRSPA